MTRLPLRYVQAWVDREGRVHRYFRRPGYPRVRLPGLPGSAEFNQAYEAALGTVRFEVGAKRTKPGTVNATIAGYYPSLGFRSLAPATQKIRRSHLERFRAKHGDKPIASLPQKFIAHELSSMKPHAARSWLKALRGLLQFAVAQDMLADDPTQGIKLPRIKTDGYYTWSETDITAFEAAHPIGTRTACLRTVALHGAEARGRAAYWPPTYSRWCAQLAPGQDRNHAGDPDPYRVAGGHRCDTGRPHDVPDHRAGQAVRRT